MKTTFLPHGRSAHANALYRRATLKLNCDISRPIRSHCFYFRGVPTSDFYEGCIAHHGSLANKSSLNGKTVTSSLERWKATNTKSFPAGKTKRNPRTCGIIKKCFADEIRRAKNLYLYSKSGMGGSFILRREGNTVKNSSCNVSN